MIQPQIQDRITYQISESQLGHKDFIHADEAGLGVVFRHREGISNKVLLINIPFTVKSRKPFVFVKMNKEGIIYHKIHDKKVVEKDLKPCMMESKKASNSNSNGH